MLHVIIATDVIKIMVVGGSELYDLPLESVIELEANGPLLEANGPLLDRRLCSTLRYFRSDFGIEKGMSVFTLITRSQGCGGRSHATELTRHLSLLRHTAWIQQVFVCHARCVGA